MTFGASIEANTVGCTVAAANSTTARVLVVSGLSNAGKSKYCDWLQREKGFEHVDTDRGGIDRFGLRSAWDKLERQYFATSLIEQATQRGRRIAIDWSYPPNDHCLEMIRALGNAGASTWFLYADPAAARRSFIAREQGLLADFDRQAAQIAQRLESIRVIYGSRFVKTLGRDGRRMSPSKIFERMYPDLTKGPHAR